MFEKEGKGEGNGASESFGPHLDGILDQPLPAVLGGGRGGGS